LNPEKDAMSEIATQRTLKETNEADLMRSALDDVGAFDILYRRWISPVFRYLYIRTGNKTDAEDLASQVFLTVYQQRSRYRHQGNFAGWLFTIARNKANQWMKHAFREGAEIKAEPADDVPSLLNQVVLNEELAQLKQLVLGLPDNQKELIYLRYVAGLSFPAMAKVLHRREDAIKKALYRLQARLYQSMEEKNE
jgi:RNA polymerase sigma-70 factor (ECF subfamily)